MQLPPASVIESWPLANHVNPPTRGPMNIIVTSIFYPIVCILVGIRCYTRVRISKNFWADDWLIFGAMVPTTAFMALGLVAEKHYKWNRHIWDVKPDTLVAGLKVVIVTEVLYSMASTLTKLSMLVLLHRIVSQGTKTLPKMIIGMMVLISTHAVVFCSSVVFQCQKPSTYWTLTFKPQPECISETANILAAGIINTIADLVVVTLPIPIIWRLKLPIQQQIIVVLLFGAGLAVIAASVIRTYCLYEVNSGWDKTWNAIPAWTTSSVELYLGIICSSIPSTKKFISRFSPRLIGASNSSRHVSKSRNTHISARESHPGPNKLELGAVAEHEHGYPDGKEDVLVQAFPAPPQRTHAVDLSPVLAGRPQTPESPKSAGWDGMDDVTKVDSEQELVDRNHHSRTQPIEIGVFIPLIREQKLQGLFLVPATQRRYQAFYGSGPLGTTPLARAGVPWRGDTALKIRQICENGP